MVWYSHLFQNFPQFIVIHAVKGFGIVNKAEIDVFLELSCFFNDPADAGNLISGSSARLADANSHQKLVEARKDSPLEPSEETQSCRQLCFRTFSYKNCEENCFFS